ncbi:MAG: multicopper oxidase family protein [Chloroflexota bacterium]
MNTFTLHKMRSGLLLLSMILALCVSAVPGSAYASTLPAATCTEASGVRTCDLWATTGTLTLPGSTALAIWGYAGDGTSAAGLPGPTLIANSGETLQINLHNNLGEATSLSIPSLSGISDRSGVAGGGTKTYTFANLQPGTYLYQAGPTANGERQVAMGLYGVLIVRPAGQPLQAYGSASAFDDEAVLVMSEIDPLLNAAPTTYNMRNYIPRYFLFNGKAYPGTANIDTLAGNTVLLRLANAGIQSRALGSLGLRQSVISMDGNAFIHPHFAAAETLGSGQTADILVDVPAGAVANQKYAIYDSSLRLLNNGARFGGMLTFINVTGTPGSGDITGPTASALSLTPNPSDGLSNIAFTATLSDAANGNDVVDQAEYFIDSTGSAGTGTALSGAFASVTEVVSASIDPSSIPSGSHTVYIHGHDAAGNWGAFTSIVLVIDKAGPSTTALSANPNATTGTVSVNISASASDSASGNSNVTVAEYFIDATGANGSGTAMTLNQTTPTVSLTASIPAATMSGLSEGDHTVYVHSQDAFGNWGAFASLLLKVDNSGPATSAVQLRPNPNNGALAYSPSFQSVRLDATFTEPGFGPITSTVANAEFFIDTVGANGTGILITPSDGSFNSASENGYSYLPLLSVNALSNGNHIISIHARDAVGNWGPFTTGVLTIDKTAPTVSGLTITPPISGNTTVALSATADDTATGNSNISAGEYFIDTAGAAGTGAAMTSGAASPNTAITATIPSATVAALTAGNHTIHVRARDAAGNWSTTTSATLLIDRTPPTQSSITLTPSSILGGTASITLSVNGASDGAGGSGVFGGEYWFGTTNPAPGAGTQFSGLSATVPTSSLAGGTYTLRARVRDVAGNWSTSFSSATLTVTANSSFPTLSVLDDFNRANANNLGANWNQANSGTNVDLRVNNNQVVANQTNDRGQAIWNVTTFGNKQAAAFTFANTTLNNSAVILKATGANITAPTSFIRVRYESGSGGRVRVTVTTNGGNSYSVIGDFTGVPFASGNTLTAMVDSTGRVYIWKTSGVTTTLLGSIQLPNNALWTTGSGRIGIQLGIGGRIDNFLGGTVP